MLPAVKIETEYYPLLKSRPSNARHDTTAFRIKSASPAKTVAHLLMYRKHDSLAVGYAIHPQWLLVVVTCHATS
jgi:hypothetical protein